MVVVERLSVAFRKHHHHHHRHHHHYGVQVRANYRYGLFMDHLPLTIIIYALSQHYRSENVVKSDGSMLGKLDIKLKR